MPIDRGAVDQALWALAVTGAGLVLSGVGAVARFAPLPVEVAALATVVDNQPRLRGWLEAVLGRPATDVGLAALATIEIIEGPVAAAIGVGSFVAERFAAMTARI